MAHLFICPNCGNRTTGSDRTAGFRRAPKGCSKCGFPFLFELLDDYYPAPDAAFFVIVSFTGIILWSSLKGRAQHGLAILILGTVLSIAVYFIWVPR